MGSGQILEIIETERAEQILEVLGGNIQELGDELPAQSVGE